MIHPMKKVNAMDMQAHFVKSAWHWRKEIRHYAAKGNDVMVNWCRGCYSESISAIAWVKRVAGRNV